MEYNNYLEEVEDISELLFIHQRILHQLSMQMHFNLQTSLVFSIVNEEPNAEEMKSKVKSYEEANRSQIVIRQSQRADEERCTADR